MPSETKEDECEATKARKQPGAVQPGAARKQPGDGRSSREQPAAVGSRQRNQEKPRSEVAIAVAAAAVAVAVAAAEAAAAAVGKRERMRCDWELE